MNLKSLQIPDDMAETGAWLDNLLLSPELVNTIIELELLAGDRLTTIQTLDSVLASDQQKILNSGLDAASESTVRGFLRQPSLLLELQEQVMINGGEFWQKKADAKFGSGKSDSVTNRGRTSEGFVQGRAHTAAVNQTTPTSVAAEGNWSRKRMIGVIAAMAAAVLVMVSFSQFGGSGSSVAKGGWGFAKSGLLDSDISEALMLEQLANASAAWHNKTPSTPAELANRLREFDQGCQALLSSRLTQLSPLNRDAVHAACEDCRESIARQLAALSNGGDITQIQSDSDAAIDTLTRAIERLT